MLLVLASGMAALVYQVLWMRQLGLLFGNTAEAAATTLAAFFTGLATGSKYFGRRASSMANPLRGYALLEWGVAVTALVYFAVIGLFYAVYARVYPAVPGLPGLPGLPGVPGGTGLLVLKFAMALLLIFPSSFCMGGTLPTMGQYLIRSRETFGRTSSLIYSINTFGAALGVLASVFVLVPKFGYRLTYLTAMALSVLVGVASWWLSRRGINVKVARHDSNKDKAPPRDQAVEQVTPHGLGRWAIVGLCFMSGFGVLALEVLWTRMFAQVHANSVYTFAVVLVVVLIGLAIGAGVSSILSRLKVSPGTLMGVLVTASGAVLVIGPTMFMGATDGMKPLTSLESWPSYMLRIFGMGVGGIGGVVVVLGTVFPYIMKVEERYADQPGRALGGLLAANTLGSILGAMLCGFVFLPWLGMWGTMRWIAVMYLVVSLVVLRGWRPGINACRFVAGVMLAMALMVLDPSHLPTTSGPVRGGSHEVLQTWEGSDCTVAVVKNDSGTIAITINSAYALGSSGAYVDQFNQSAIPLDIYPQTRSIFYLGLGTAVSAGASLDPSQFPNIERVVAAELVPEVITAAKKYFTDVDGEDLTGGIFKDPRATVLAVDGRQYLRVTRERFDMVNADLFLPYRRGAGSLYSLEHYRAAGQRLNPGGVYVQWLPMFQLTQSEFGIIAHTMLQAFDRVTMWRNNFTPGHEIVALIGQNEPAPIPASPRSLRDDMLNVVEVLQWSTTTPEMPVPESPSITFFYAGNLTAAEKLFERYPINTDDNPLIEYQTPRTFRQNARQRVIWFVGPKLTDMIDKIFALSPVETDPVLANRTRANRLLAQAGEAFHKSMVHRAMDEPIESQHEWQRFIELWRAGAD